jgi:hypothetical protein
MRHQPAGEQIPYPQRVVMEVLKQARERITMVFAAMRGLTSGEN